MRFLIAIAALTVFGCSRPFEFGSASDDPQPAPADAAAIETDVADVSVQDAPVQDVSVHDTPPADAAIDGYFTLTAVEPLPRLYAFRELAAVDLDLDGHLDLFAGSSERYAWFRGDGHGDLAPPQPLPSPPTIFAFRVGHLDGDQIPDVATIVGGAANAGNAVVWQSSLGGTALSGFGEGTSSAPITLVDNDYFTDLAIADVDGDTRDDLIALGAFHLWTWLGHTRNTPAEFTGFAAALVKSDLGRISDVKHLRITDVDGDGHPDVLFTANLQDGMNNGSALLFARGDGHGQFAAPVVAGLYPDFNAFDAFVIGDLDEDKIADVLILGPHGQRLHGRGDGTFTPLGAPTAVTSLQAGDLADFNEDGHLDLPSNTLGNGFPQLDTLWLLRGDGKFDFNAQSLAQGGATTWSQVNGDFNEDGHLDIVAGAIDGTLSILSGRGDRTFTNNPQYHGPARSMSLADIDGDGRLDLVAFEFHSIDVFRGRGDGTLQPPVSTPTGVPWLRVNAPQAPVLGDFDEDGRIDVVATVQESRLDNAETRLYRSSGGGALTATVLPQIANLITTADFNHDGHADLVGFDLQKQLVFYAGDGRGGFAAALLGAALPEHPAAGVAGDFNHDGRMDLLTGGFRRDPGVGYLRAVYAFAGNGDGTFLPPVETNVDFGFLERMTGGDFDGDGVFDLVAVDLNVISTIVLRGLGDGRFEVKDVHSLWSDATLLDLDGDGRDDLIETGKDGLFVSRGGSDGLGPKTQLDGVAAGAYLIVSGDLNGDGRQDLVAEMPDRYGAWVLRR